MVLGGKAMFHNLLVNPEKWLCFQKKYAATNPRVARTPSTRILSKNAYKATGQPAQLNFINVGTVPTFNFLNRGTIPTFNHFLVIYFFIEYKYI